jgi:hypothetical protein
MNTASLKSQLGTKIKNINNEMPPVSVGMTQMVTATAPAVGTSDYIVLRSNALEIIRENLKNHRLSRASIDTVKAPSGGSIVFMVPGIAGDDIQKELTGIILDYTTPRAYWDSADPVEGTPPTCYSPDSQVSYEGKLCSQCPFNEFGSKDNGNGESRSKACKESVEIFLLRQDNIMPIVVRIPVSSKAIFQRYMTRLVSHMLPACGVVTKITLEKATSKGGQPYAKFNFEAISTLTPEEVNGIRSFSSSIMEVLTAAAEQDLKQVG